VINDNPLIMDDELFDFPLADERVWQWGRIAAKPYEHQQKRATAPDGATSSPPLAFLCRHRLFPILLQVFRQILDAFPKCIKAACAASPIYPTTPGCQGRKPDSAPVSGRTSFLKIPQYLL
jgi:hypothetical protein